MTAKKQQPKAPEGQRQLGEDEMIVMPIRAINVVTGVLGDMPYKVAAPAFSAIQSNALPLDQYLAMQEKKGEEEH